MEASPEGVTVVFMTTPDVETAERIGRVLVDERLAACANLLPGVTSLYRWDGEIKNEPEVLVIVKTTTPAVERLIARVTELHPYEVPEVLALPAEAGANEYMSWVSSEVEGG